MSSFCERHLRTLTALAIVVMASLQVATILGESATFDEAVHLSAGYRYWRTGKFAMNVEHPPLQKLLSAAPLLALGPPMPSDPKLLIDQTEYAKAFVYGGPRHADTLLLLGRAPTILLSALLVAAVAWAGRRFFGAAAGAMAAWFCALDPNLIAHGRYVTTDMISALLGFVAVALWLRYLDSPSTRGMALTGLMTGLALAAKFSSIYLVGLFPALLGLHWIYARFSWRAAAALAGVLGVAALTVAVTYAPESWRAFRGRVISVEPETIAGYTLPAHPYFTGLKTVLRHNEEGHPTYLFGEVSKTGWWYYFPAVVAVKSTTAFLLLLAALLGIAAWRLPRLFGRSREVLPWLFFGLPPALYFASSVASNINLGIRHLLPVYPFLYVVGAAALAAVLPARRLLPAAGLLLTLHAGESLAAYPEYLGFFNTPAGGGAAGSKYLLDSNLDWGQDLKKLKAYIDEKQPGTVCLEYFGSVEPGYYGIRYEYLPRTWNKDERERADCLGVISITLLHDVYIDPGSFAWLRERTPVGRVGSSLVLFDLRKR